LWREAQAGLGLSLLSWAIAALSPVVPFIFVLTGSDFV
jgi:hypothetical protein